MAVNEQPWKPTGEQLEAATDGTVPDVIGAQLRVLFTGINPGLYTAAVGHHFARPGNRFWKVLHLSGFTPRQMSPFDDASLVELGLGITNVVPRATATADELSKEEIRVGGEALRRKVLRYQPAFLAVLGVQAYRIAFRSSKARVGEQPERIGDTRVWVLPNPSGLQAHYQLPDLVRLHAELRLAAFPLTRLHPPELCDRPSASLVVLERDGVGSVAQVLRSGVRGRPL